MIGTTLTVHSTRRLSLLRCYKELGHRVARTVSEFTHQGAVVNIAIGAIKAMRRLCTIELAPHIAAFGRPRFERAQQRPTSAAKPRVRRNGVQKALARMA